MKIRHDEIRQKYGESTIPSSQKLHQ